MRTELILEKEINMMTSLNESGTLRIDFSIHHYLDYTEDAQKLAKYLRFCATHLDSLAEIMQNKR